ncbi:MAG: TonB-dependent receptor plug domain-containing protein [Cyclobacteriaceae bacterium]|nr:TonB-dependent receptor plug domain-containing protein [Cyclobacteriaceae bacterium]
MTPRWHHIALLMLCALQINAQDTFDEEPIVLQGIEVQASRWTRQSGFRQVKVDSLRRSQHVHENLAQLLENNTSLFIKSYGLGGLATPSFRGTGASHTQVYWEGFNINSPMLGQVDLSLIPVAATEHIYLDYGGASLQHGTGGLGGSILLDSRPEFTKRWKGYAGITSGSFGMRNVLGQVTGGDEKWQINSRFYHRAASNDFPFMNSDKEWVRTQNAAFRQLGLMQDIYFKSHLLGTFSLKSWIQETDRNIQPPITVRINNEQIEDNFFRITGAWEKSNHHSMLKLSTAWFRESLIYENPAASVRSDNEVQSFRTKARGSHRINDAWMLTGGSDFFSDRADASVYNNIMHQQRLSLFSGTEYDGTRINFSFLIRTEWVDSLFSGPLPSLGIQYKLTGLPEGSWLRTNVSRNFRALTLNENFWAAEAGRSLLPESSWSAEMGLEVRQKMYGMELHHDVSLFSNWVDNWILWRPGVPSWRPENIQQVWARGFEYAITLNHQAGAWGFIVQGSYTFTRSTSRYPVHGLDNSANRQLIFIPEHEARIDGGISFRKYSIGLSQAYVSTRYVSSDHNAWLPAYLLTDLWTGRSFAIRKSLVELRGTIKNLWDFNYQVIPNYAMPGRYAEVSLFYHFNKKP